MLEVLRRLLTFTVIASLAAYAVFIAANAAIYANEQSRQRIVWIRDEIGPNTHHLAGAIPVKNSCTQISLKTEKISEIAYRLAFRTWEHPSMRCGDEPGYVSFRETVFAPATGVIFVATMDDLPFPILVVPVADY